MANGEGTEAGGPGRQEVRAVPEIRVRPVPEGELEIALEGPLVPYGSFLREGDVEVFDWFHYPGGLWRERTTSEVRETIEIAGKACVEVHVDYLSTEEGKWAFDDGAEELFYVSRCDDGLDAGEHLRVPAVDLLVETSDGVMELPLEPLGVLGRVADAGPAFLDEREEVVSGRVRQTLL